MSYFPDIWPVIQRRCQKCHQPSVKQGNLDHYEGFRTRGKSGPAFVPGDPDNSLVFVLIAGKRYPRMPLGQPPLGEDQILLFSQWIQHAGQDDTRKAAGRQSPSCLVTTYY